MKKISCRGRNNLVCYIEQSWFPVFSGTLVLVLFILSSLALWYG